MTLKIESRDTSGLIAAAMDIFHPKLVEWLSGLHRSNQAGHVVDALGPYKTAEVTCKMIATQIHRNPYKRDLSRMIGQEIEDQINQLTLDNRWWQQRWKALLTQAGKTKARTIMRREGDHVKFPLKGMVMVGAYMINHYADWVGGIAFERKPKMGYKGSAVQVVPTVDLLEWLRENKPDDASGWAPLHEMPYWEGPYLKGRKFVHHKGEFGREKTCLEHCDDATIQQGLRSALRAANHLQSVAWRRNDKIHRVVKEAWRSGGGLATVPAAEQPPMPPYTTNRAYASYKESLYSWRMKRRTVASLLYAAESMQDGPNYWLWGADFRGRLYPLSGQLSPQGPDLGRALIEFDEGRPLGPEGCGALGEHGANMWGSRGTMDQVGDWLIENEDMIVESAKDPFACQWWAQANKPWRFLAFCYDWVGWLEQGEHYVCHTACQLDASCNCYQIMATLLRDYDLAKLVNLTDSHKIHDLYDYVAKETMIKLKERRPTWLPEWKRQQAVIPRDVAKLALIRYCLGGKPFSAANAVQAWIINRWKWEWPYGEVKAGTMSFHFAHAIKKVLDEICSLRELHKWMRAMAKGKGLVEWTSPSGFPVVCEYLDYESLQISGKGNQFSCYGDPIAQNPKGVQRGLIANYIHSLDGAIMHLILNQLEDEGIEVSAIHDCIGAHARDVGRIHTIAREVYARVFSRDLLGQLAVDMGGDPYDGPLPNDYNPTEVLDADYMWR